MRLTKFGKKIIAILAILVLGVTLTSCLNDSEKDKGYKEAQEAVEGAISNVILDQDNYVVADITLASSHAWYPDVKYSWTSSEADVITVITNADGTITGSVSAPDPEDPRAKTSGEDVYVPVELTVVCTQEAEGKTATATKKFTVKVKCASADVKGTVSEVKSFFVDKMIAAGAVFNNYRETIYAVGYGRVLYQWSKSMVVADEKSAVVVYGNYTDICTVGDLVKVEGNVKSYYGQVEFDTSNVKKLDETDEHASITLPEYKETTINEYTADINASIDAANKIVDKAKYNNYSGATLKVFAKVVQKSESAELQATKDEFGLQDPYTGEIVAIYHYSTDATEDTATFNALVGKYVTIEVITYDRYSSNNCFRVLWNGKAPVEGEAPVLDDEQKVTMAAKAVEAAAETAFASTYYNGDAFTTPTVKVAEGVKVEWTVSPSELVKDGKWVVTADGTATIKATISCGNASQEVTVTVKVKVSKPQGEEGKTVYSFEELPAGSELNDSSILALLKEVEVGANGVASATASKVYQGNGTGGAKPEAAGLIKFGTKDVNGVLTITYSLGTVVTKVEVKCHDFYAKSEQYPNGSNKISVNGAAAVATPYNADATPEVLSFDIAEPTNTVTISSVGRIVIYEIVVYFGEKQEVSDEVKAQQFIDSLEVPTTVTEDFTLTEAEGLTWTLAKTTFAELNQNVVSVTRPAAGQENATISLTATYKLNSVEKTKTFTVTIEAEEAANHVELDFAGNFATYGKEWKNSYSEHTVTGAELGVSKVDVNVDFSRASKQTSTVTDRPVIASADQDVYITVSLTDATFTTITFNFKEWSSSKKFTKFVVEYTTDGSTWVEANVDGTFKDLTSDTAKRIPETLTFDSIPENVTGVRVVVNGSSYYKENKWQNQQLAITTIEFEFKKND